MTFDNMALALQAFETTLITQDSRFDRYLKGDDKALSDAELNGLKTFIGSGCIACHSGQVWSLKEVVAIMDSAQPGKQLSEADVDAITLFLGTLTGRQPQLNHPLLPVSTDKTPHPQQ